VIKQVWSRGNERCSGNKTNVIRWYITFVLSPEHLPLSLDQTCFITSSLLFYHPSTFHYLFIKLVLSPDHICFITRAPSITSWSNLFYHLITFVLSLEHLPLSLDQTCFITSSHLFYHKCDQVIKQVWWRGNRRCLGNKTNVIRW
jgi:hypothetical protein